MLLAEFWSDTDELHHATLASQVAHLLIESLRRQTALIDVAQYQRMATATMVWTAVHEVEGDVERIDIAVVAVVDKGATMLSHLHFQSHRHRFQFCHALVDILGRNTELRSHHGTDDGVLDRCIIDEWNGEAVNLTFIYIGDDAHVLLLLDVLHIERSLRVLERPEEFFSLVIRIFSHHLGNQFVIAIVNHGLCIMEEDKLFSALLLQGREVLLMGRTHIGEYGDSRLDDVTQGKHLARLTDTSLEHAHLGLLVHEPDRQWHTYLRIVTAWTAGDEHAR